jgi:hypothetical protein
MSMSTTSGRSRRDHANGSVAVRSLPDDLDVVLTLEHELQPGAHQILVVNEHHSDHHVSDTGSQAWTENPPCTRGPASNRPPSSAARSRIPASPYCRDGISTPSPRPSSVAVMSRQSVRYRRRISICRAGVLHDIRHGLLDHGRSRVQP